MPTIAYPRHQKGCKKEIFKKSFSKTGKVLRLAQAS
jgi:hypothetical protein